MRPAAIRNKRSVQSNKARPGAALVLSRNLEEVRQRNLLHKREMIRRPSVKKVRSITFHKLPSFPSYSTDTNPRSSRQNRTYRHESH